MKARLRPSGWSPEVPTECALCPPHHQAEADSINTCFCKTQAREHVTTQGARVPGRAVTAGCDTSRRRLRVDRAPWETAPTGVPSSRTNAGSGGHAAAELWTPPRRPRPRSSHPAAPAAPAPSVRTRACPCAEGHSTTGRRSCTLRVQGPIHAFSYVHWGKATGCETAGEEKRRREGRGCGRERGCAVSPGPGPGGRQGGPRSS